MQEKILSRHECRAVLLSCIDFRFGGQRTAKALEETYGLHENEYDVVTLPGGAQNLTRFQLGQQYADASLDSLDVAIGLHHVSEVVILSHQNCGALKAVGHVFGDGEEVSETDFHRALLLEAHSGLMAKWPNLKIHAGYLHVDNATQAVIISSVVT